MIVLANVLMENVTLEKVVEAYVTMV